MGSFGSVALQGSIRGLFPHLLLFFLFYTNTSGSSAEAADGAAACRNPVARVVSIQGAVEMQAAGQANWSPITRLDTVLCDGDKLRTGPLGRSALFVQPESLVRVDRSTTISVTQLPDETLIEFFQSDLRPVASNSCGAGYFISRFPKKFKVKAPHLSAAVEGTEFLVALSCDMDRVSVFEGKVLASQTGGNGQSVLLEAGQTASAGPGEAPVIKLNIKPEDAVQWVVYYPPINPPDANIEEDCRAVSSERRAPCLVARAERLLRAGHVDEARNQINDAIAVAPLSSDAKALQSIISLVRNEKSEALRLANEAVAADPKSAPAWLALSYAQQSDFKLEAALTSAHKAVEITPNNALALARVAELQLSLGWNREAEKTAQQAVAANDSESRAHMILGFVHLSQVKVKEARENFERAIELDSAEPLSRLGLGLAIIRKGNLAEGREQIEIAVALDPTNSLLRSYVGKAYYEENTKERDLVAATQFGLAKELDPKDPTPWFYDALRKQGQSQPVEALADLQRSIDLNDSRAVYRSSLLLDQDLASRSADLANIYTELGFSDLAVAKASTSLALDPSNYSAHRFLSDIYATRPRHEIARSSELLQAQLRQPLKPVPIQSEVANDAFFSATPGLGPLRAGINEFNPLFERDKFDLSLYGVSDGNNTRGEQAVATGVFNSAAAGFSYFNYETDGFRENADEKKNVWTAYLGAQTTPDSSFQAEFTHSNRDFGSLVTAFDSTRVDPTRNLETIDSARFGGRTILGSRSELLFSFIGQESINSSIDPSLGEATVTNNSTKLELQHVYSMPSAKYVTGMGAFTGETHEDIFGFLQFDSNPTHFNAYGYGYFSLPNKKLSLQLGAAFDRLNTRDSGLQEQVSPKLGLVWEPIPRTTVRAAYFEVLKRRVNSDQGLEPTQVAGFNQFYDDVNGTESRRAAFAVDSRITDNFYVGAEASRRELFLPLTNIDGTIEFLPWNEEEQRAYAHYVMNKFAVASIAVTHEVHSRLPGLRGAENFINLEQFYVPLSLRFFLAGGVSAIFSVNYLSQKGTFPDALGSSFEDEESTWLSDLAIQFQLPRRVGTLSFEGRNIFDEQFRYQSVSIGAVPFALERTWMLRLALRL